MAIGPLAQLAIERTVSASLRKELDDLQCGFCTREREAYDSGVQHGRAAWPIGFLFGFMCGAASVGLYFVLFG